MAQAQAAGNAGAKGSRVHPCVPRGRGLCGRSRALDGWETPVVLIQNTGLFESGDVSRSTRLGLELPLLLLIGYRGYTDRIFSAPGVAGLMIWSSEGAASHLLSRRSEEDHLPLNCGGRFSAKALAPSIRSSVVRRSA